MGFRTVGSTMYSMSGGGPARRPMSVSTKRPASGRGFRTGKCLSILAPFRGDYSSGRSAQSATRAAPLMVWKPMPPMRVLLVSDT